MGLESHYRKGNLHFWHPDYSPQLGASLWETCPLLALLSDPAAGVMLWENWSSFNTQATTGDYVLTQATTGTAAVSTARTGVLELDSNSTTATQGVQIQRVKSPFVPTAGSKIWAEFELKVVDTFDKAEIFVGLSEIDTTIIASSANSSANHVGWEITNDDGVLLFAGEKAGARGTVAAATIAEDAYIKLGFLIDGTTSIQQYLNGVAVGNPIATANVPTVALYPSLVCQSGGTNDPIAHVKPYRIVQLF